MSFLLINIILAAAPSIAIVIYFYRKDFQKPEPKMLILKIFILGFFAVIPAFLLEVFLQPFSYFSGRLIRILFQAFIVAAFVEEGIKFSVVRLFIYPKKEFDEITDGIIYAITASLGFAFFENVMYSFGPTSTIIIRGITAVPLHAIASGIMGYYIGLSKFTPVPLFKKGLLAAVLIHGLYDFFLFTGTWLSVLVIPLLIICGRILLKLYKKALEEDRLAGRI